MYKNILIIGHANIGDVCYDLIVVWPLRKQFPEAKISFLTSSRAKNIVEGYKGLDQIITFDKLAKDKGLLGRLRLMSALKKEKFDLAVVLKNTWMPRFLDIPRIWSVRPFLKQKSENHIANIYLDLLRSKDIVIQDTDFGFNLDSEKNFCDSFLRKNNISPKDKLIGMLPNAAWSLKNWPVEKWNELALTLKQTYKIRFVNLGKTSADPFDQMVAKKISPEIISASETTLKQAMSIIERCDLFVGPDSSLLHLASCLGTETIGLYGPTSAETFHPYFHRENCIISEIKWACAPCYPSLKFCSCKEVKDYGDCMADISIEQVLSLIKQKLAL